MPETDTWFLLVQYRHQGRTEITDFSDAAQAAFVYGEAEREFKDKIKGLDPEMDVLLVGASSREVVRKLYPSYFTTAKSTSEKVKSLLAALPFALVH